jgi:hypothetical protein
MYEMKNMIEMKGNKITRNSVLYCSALRTWNYQGAREIRDT